MSKFGAVAALCLVSSIAAAEPAKDSSNRAVDAEISAEVAALSECDPTYVQQLSEEIKRFQAASLSLIERTDSRAEPDDVDIRVLSADERDIVNCRFEGRGKNKCFIFNIANKQDPRGVFSSGIGVGTHGVGKTVIFKDGTRMDESVIFDGDVDSKNTVLGIGIDDKPVELCRVTGRKLLDVLKEALLTVGSKVLIKARL